MPNKVVPIRRSQEERRASTQRALLDAAVGCLIEDGYQGFSTTTVADRAKVSRGAQLHHYPTRAALVAAAVAHVFAGLTDDYRRAFAALDERDRSPARAVGLLQAICRDPRHHAVLDLYAAARTDSELRDGLVPVAAQHRANVIELAGKYFPQAAGNPRFRLTLDLLLHAVVGMALARGLYGEDPSEPQLTTLIETLATEAAGEQASGAQAATQSAAPDEERAAAMAAAAAPDEERAAAATAKDDAPRGARRDQRSPRKETPE